MYLQSGSSRSRQTSDKFPLFASLHFNLLGNKLSNLLKWDPKEYLRHPLLNLHPAISDRAMKANKLIVDFMEKAADEEEKLKNCEISESDVLQVSVLVKMGCEGPNECGIEIRDEIYCQLVKQTTNNVNRRSCFRGYQLLLSCLAGFPPSETLAPFLLSHLHIGCHGGAMLSRRTVKIAENCLRALEMAQKLGTRRWGLTRNEIIAIVSGNCALTVKIWLTRDFAIDISVDSWMTIKELRNAACEKVGILDTSILTISAISSSTDELGKQEDSDNLASSRGVMSALYDQLYHHYLMLAANNSDESKIGGLKAIFGKTKCLQSCLSERTVFALDSFLQVEILSETSGYCFNESDNCMDTQRAEPCQHMRKFPMRPLSYMKKCLATPVLSLNVTLKLYLIVWIFPPEDFSQKKSNIALRDQDEEYLGEKVTTCDEFDDEAHDIHIADFFGSLSLQGIYESPAKPFEQRGPYWPRDEAARNVLFAQLIISIAKGNLECTNDTETLRLAALTFAEQHQQEHRAQGVLPSIAFMQEAVQAHLADVLPSNLINMLPSLRATAGTLIKKKLRDILDYAADDSPTDGEFGFCSFPNIMGLDCLEKSARSRNRSKHRIHSNLSNEITPRTMRKKKEYIQGINWAVQSIWMEFLCSVIVRFWLLHLDSLSARECRDEYLQSATHCVGYGIVKFCPARVKISILTKANEDEIRQERQLSYEEAEMGVRWYSTSICESLNQDNEVGASAKATWLPVESIYTRNISSAQLQGSSRIVAKSLQLAISAEEVTVTEHVTKENTLDLLEIDRVVQITRDYTEGRGENKDAEIHQENITTPRLLLNIAMDDIISWGYNDEELVIKFKQREGHHEDSYYSDDSDEGEDGNDSQGDERSERDQNRNEWARPKRSCSEAVSFASPTTTASGCPIRSAKCCRQIDVNEEIGLEYRSPDNSDKSQCKESGKESNDEHEEWGVKPVSADESGDTRWPKKIWRNDICSSESKLSNICESVSNGETKELDAQEVNHSGFVTDASSNVNVPLSTATASRGNLKYKERRRKKFDAERREAVVKRREDIGDGHARSRSNSRGHKKKQSDRIDSVWHDSVHLVILYGMEIAELLELYSIQRDQKRINATSY